MMPEVVRTLLIWGLFAYFVVVATGQFFRYWKYRRLDSVFHAIAFYLTGIIGLFAWSFIPFIAGFILTGIVSLIVVYRRRQRDSPSATELANQLFDDTAQEKRSRREDGVIRHAFADSDNREIISEYGLTQGDFVGVFDAMLRAASRSEAEIAMHAPHILRWYFTNVGVGGHMTFDQSVEFACMIKDFAAREG